MINMKCPICGTILDKAFITDKIRGCPKCRNMGNIKLWQELIHTRKALEIAVDAVKEYTDEKRYDWERSYELHSAETAKKALEQITALEQKDK